MFFTFFEALVFEFTKCFVFFWCRPTVEEVYSRVAVFLSMRGILYSDNGVVCVNFF